VKNASHARSHVQGVVDIDALTFDKTAVAVPNRPVFVVFYDANQPQDDQVGLGWILEQVAKTTSDHLRLLIAKMDASAPDARMLKQRFNITNLPEHVLFEGVDKQTLYVMAPKDADAATKLESWLIEQVRHHPRQARVHIPRHPLLPALLQVCSAAIGRAAGRRAVHTSSTVLATKRAALIFTRTPPPQCAALCLRCFQFLACAGGLERCCRDVIGDCRHFLQQQRLADRRVGSSTSAGAAATAF
jgi:hypothetical protein